MFIALILIVGIVAALIIAFLHRSLDTGSSNPAVSYSSLPDLSHTKSVRPAMLNAALSVACDLAMRDFVYSWWRQYTDDENFPNHIRGLVAQAFRITSEDLSKVNWPCLFRQYVQIIRDKVMDRKPAENIAVSLPVKGAGASVALPAVNTSNGGNKPDAIYLEYCRHSIHRILQHVLPQEKTVNIMLEELLLSTVVTFLFSLLHPDNLNQMLLDVLTSDSETIHCVISEWIEAQTSIEQEGIRNDLEPELSNSSIALHSMPSSVWKVDIVQAMLRFDPKPYVAYRIEIRYGQSLWEICRRYNDFFKLHNQLRRQVGYAFSGQVPKRNFRDKFKKAFIESRRLDLHRYLQQVISCPECLQTSTLFEWLSPRASDLVTVASPVGHDSSQDLPKNRLLPADAEPGFFKDLEMLDSEDPMLRFLVADILSLFRLLLGNDISLRTKTGYRILYKYAPRAILKEMRKFTFNDFFARILVWITTTVWPNGVLVENTVSNVTRTEEERRQLQAKTETAVLRIIPKSVVVMLGQNACEKVVRNVIATLNQREKLSEAVCIMLETTVDHFVSQRKAKDPSEGFTAA